MALCRLELKKISLFRHPSSNISSRKGKLGRLLWRNIRICFLKMCCKCKKGTQRIRNIAVTKIEVANWKGGNIEKFQRKKNAQRRSTRCCISNECWYIELGWMNNCSLISRSKRSQNFRSDCVHRWMDSIMWRVDNFSDTICKNGDRCLTRGFNWK